MSTVLRSIEKRITPTTLVVGSAVALFGLAFLFRKKPVSSSTVGGRCTSPILRSSIAVLRKAWNREVARVEADDAAAQTCAAINGGEGIDGMSVYKWSIYPRISGDAFTAFHLVMAKVQVDDTAGLSFMPEAMSVVIDDVYEANGLISSFFAGMQAIGGVQ